MSSTLGNGGTRTKVRFEPGAEQWHGSASETLWAEEVGPNQYRLENSPFFAFGVSYKDVVLASPVGTIREFIRVATRGGHSTYRIIPASGRTEEFASYWSTLKVLGCNYEEGPNTLRAVDVPPRVSVFDVYEALKAGEDAGVWTFEEGHCGHATA